MLLSALLERPRIETSLEFTRLALLSALAPRPSYHPSGPAPRRVILRRAAHSVCTSTGNGIAWNEALIRLHRGVWRHCISSFLRHGDRGARAGEEVPLLKMGAFRRFRRESP